MSHGESLIAANESVPTPEFVTLIGTGAGSKAMPCEAPNESDVFESWMIGDVELFPPPHAAKMTQAAASNIRSIQFIYDSCFPDLSADHLFAECILYNFYRNINPTLITIDHVVCQITALYRLHPLNDVAANLRDTSARAEKLW
jgi:hypothetical protein